MDGSGTTSDEGSPSYSSTTVIAAAASVGSVVACLVMGLACILLVTLLVRRRRSGRRGEWTLSIPEGVDEDDEFDGKKLNEGIENAVYSCKSKMPEDYIPPCPEGTEKKGDTYSYANADSIRISFRGGGISRGGDNNSVFKPKQQNSSRLGGKYNSYVAPPCEEEALYAQIVDIRIEELSRELIQLGETLGMGCFGLVKQGLMQMPSSGNQGVAVKTLKEEAESEDRVRFLQEAAIMGQFRHPNIVKLHGVVMKDDPVMIVLELLGNGDLRKYLEDQKYQPSLSIDEHTLLSYCRQIASGMVYLSNKAFIHRDLAARNVLLSDKGICKIADFGMARDLTDEEYYISHGGKIPVKWTAPEAIGYRKYSMASDVWSYGVLLFEIWSIGSKPYEGVSIRQVLERIEEGHRLTPPPGIPRPVYELMINTWDFVTSLRPTFEDIMQTLSLPDTVLLEPEDGANRGKLGSELCNGYSLYSDLQNKYL